MEPKELHKTGLEEKYLDTEEDNMVLLRTKYKDQGMTSGLGFSSSVADDAMLLNKPPVWLGCTPSEGLPKEHHSQAQSPETYTQNCRQDERIPQPNVLNHWHDSVAKGKAYTAELAVFTQMGL